MHILTKDVLKFEISNKLSNRQKSNILSIFVTNDVLKFDKLRKSNFRHSSNILCIFVTNDVLKLDTSKNSKELQKKTYKTYQ